MRMRLALSSVIFVILAGTALAQGQSQNPAQPTPAPALQPAPQPGSTIVQVPSQAPAFFTGEARVHSRVDKTVITVGEIINYRMEVEIPKGYSAAIPPPGAQLGQFLIRKYEFPEPEKKADRMILRFNFQITAYTTEELSIPPVPVIIRKDKQIAKVILSEEIKINIAPVTSAEDLEIKDIKPPGAVPFEYKPLLIAGSIIAGLVALALGGIYGWRRLSQPRLELPEPLPEPEELALKELAELVALNLLEKGELDQYYTRLSEIIRRYLGLRFQIYALEFTTTEIMDSLKEKWLEHFAYQLIREFLDECDLVKFAKFIPEPKSQKQIMEKAKQIIEQTRPVAPAEEVKAVAQGAG